MKEYDAVYAELKDIIKEFDIEIIIPKSPMPDTEPIWTTLPDTRTVSQKLDDFQVAILKHRTHIPNWNMRGPETDPFGMLSIKKILPSVIETLTTRPIYRMQHARDYKFYVSQNAKVYPITVDYNSEHISVKPEEHTNVQWKLCGADMYYWGSDENLTQDGRHMLAMLPEPVEQEENAIVGFLVQIIDVHQTV